MKKTIAILLVLVLAGVGLFAATASDPTTTDASATLDLTASVKAINRLGITKAFFEGTTLGDFEGQTLLEDAVAVGSGTLAHLNVLTNSSAGVFVRFSATPMGGAIAANTYKIDYTVTCNGADYSTVLTGDPLAPAAAETIVANTTAKAAADGLYIASFPITAAFETGSFENAPEDEYTGTVTFTIAAT